MGRGVVEIPGLLSTEEAAEALGVSVITIYRWRRAGKLIALDVGGRPLFPQSEIERSKNQTTGDKPVV